LKNFYDLIKDISVVKWSKILYTLVNITGIQFFGRKDPAVDEFFDNNNNFDINPPLVPNERSLRV
jgi:hypothetical protein